MFPIKGKQATEFRWTWLHRLGAGYGRAPNL